MASNPRTVSSARAQVQLSGAESAAGSLEVDVDHLLDNPDQPRRFIDSGYVSELASTIRLHGLLFKPAARLVNGKYQLVAGHCRRDAFKLNRDSAPDATERERWSMIPITLVEMTDEQSAMAALIENIQREDLSAAEEGEAYARLQEKYGYASVRALAERLGVDEQRIARRIRIHNGPLALKDALTRGIRIAAAPEDGGTSRRPELRKLSYEAGVELLRLHGYLQKKFPGVEGGKANPRTCAEVKLDPVIERVLGQGWSTQKVRAYVSRVLAGASIKEADDAEATAAKAAVKGQIVEHRGESLVLHLKRLGDADAASRTAAFEAVKAAFEAARKPSKGPQSAPTKV
jgi:ParB/RepB/Spo0J family partition protein